MRLSEVYLSIQGEGPRVGKPTVFVRFAGCNLKCPGWPCDTDFAINPAFRADWLTETPQEVFARIEEAAQGISGINICLTGGEPFLQNKDEMLELCNLLDDLEGIDTIECFSNGVLEYPEWAFSRIAFVMDWKLPGSGEGEVMGKRRENFAHFTNKDAVKFTIADDVDLAKAIEIWENEIDNEEAFFASDGEQVQIFYGAVWGKIENGDLIEKVLELGLSWRFTMQIHNHVWSRDERGI